jgi:tetratricopeptide (TPR) repeat protein
MAAKTVVALLISLAFAAPARAALSQTAELSLEKGLHHLYNLDYAESRADFRKLIEKEPDNPFGYLFESGGIWWQSSLEYGLFKDTPTLQGLFEQDVEAAIRKADVYNDSKDKVLKADGLFVEGMALGTRGQWNLMKGNYIKAFFDGKKAMKLIKKTLKLDPDYRDADLGLGVFEYQAAHLSGIAKLSSILGVRGDEKKGIALLKSAHERGRYGTGQAGEFLLMIYIMDKKDWHMAVETLKRQRAQFPESVYFESLELLSRWKLGQKAESAALGRSVFDKAKADPKAFNRKLLSLVCGLMADNCLGKDQVAESLAWLDHALESTPEPKPARPSKTKAARPNPADADTVQYLSLLHLYRGYMRDASGKTDEASADYDWVLKHPDFSDNHARAKECHETGCGAKQVLLYLRSLSLGEHPETPK